MKKGLLTLGVGLVIIWVMTWIITAAMGMSAAQGLWRAVLISSIWMGIIGFPRTGLVSVLTVLLCVTNAAFTKGINNGASTLVSYLLVGTLAMVFLMDIGWIDVLKIEVKEKATAVNLATALFVIGFVSIFVLLAIAMALGL